MQLLKRYGLALCLLLGGCSAGTRVAYNNLDSLAAWQLSDYVELDPAQKAAFQTQFRSIWNWHRQTQLPAYAVDFRAMAAATEQGAPTREAVDAFLVKIEHHGDALGERIRIGLQALLPALSDAQVASLIAHQRKDIEKMERKHADETPEERHKRFLRNVASNFDRWIGDLNDTQKAAADRVWTAGLATLPTATQRAKNRLADLQRFADLMATRKSPGFDDRLLKFWNHDQDPQWLTTEQGRNEAADEARQRQFTIEIVTTLDAPQRKKLRGQLLDLAEDCDALAATRVASEGAARP